MESCTFQRVSSWVDLRALYWQGEGVLGEHERQLPRLEPASALGPHGLDAPLILKRQSKA